MGRRKKPNRYNVIQPQMVTGSGGTSGLGSLTNFTNAQDIKNRFWTNAASRRQAGDKAYGDAGYWTEGRCNWGGNHNLDEDSQVLANWANDIVSTQHDAQELTLAVNEQEFNQKKQALVSKYQGCISRCQISSTSSIGGICCIWSDYFGSFVAPFANELKQDLQSRLSELQSIDPIHQRKILELEAELREVETKYNDAMTKAATETDPAKKVQFIAIAQAAEQTIRQAKTRLANNPLSKLAQYSYINNIGRLLNGNVPSSFPRQPQSDKSELSSDSNNSGGGMGEGRTNPTGGQTPWTPWGGSGSGNTNNQSNQQQLLILAGIVVLVIFYLMNQKDYD
jgi:hypothetical protein